MKKEIILGLLIILALTPFSAAEFDLKINKTDKGSVIIKEIRNPVIYEFEITNNMQEDWAEIYSLVGMSMVPKGTFHIPSGLSKLEIKAYPSNDYLKNDGLYSIEYQIKGETNGIFKDQLLFNVVSLENVFELRPTNIHPNDQTIVLRIKNKVNANIEDVKIHFDSLFFDVIDNINFKPYEEINVSIRFDKSKITKLRAGEYPMSATITLDKASHELVSTINYLEKEGTSVTTHTSGFLILKSTVKKTNEGNIPVTASLEMKKDIVSRLFTSYSASPLVADRDGLFVDYNWKEELNPGESYSVVAVTNYTFPFIAILAIFLASLLVWIYSSSALVLNKSVTYIRTKGGEFALKVKVHAKAKRHVSNVTIKDRIPHMTDLYDKFGHFANNFDKNTKHLSWDISHLAKGEERIFSYILYSKMQTVGRFELPQAFAKFEHQGKNKEIVSNKAFLVSELHAHESNDHKYQ